MFKHKIYFGLSTNKYQQVKLHFRSADVKPEKWGLNWVRARLYHVGQDYNPTSTWELSGGVHGRSGCPSQKKTRLPHCGSCYPHDLAGEGVQVAVLEASHSKHVSLNVFPPFISDARKVTARKYIRLGFIASH